MTQLPVARVAVDLPLAHLDRLFDYLVPDALLATALPGTRVRVRFAGQLVGGFVVERAAASEHSGRLSSLAKVVSDEPVLTPDVARLARAVADRYCGTLADVLRLAIPPRHAQAEREESASAPPLPPQTPAETWALLPDGPAFLDALAAQGTARAVAHCLPRTQWDLISEAAGVVRPGGGGVLVVVPDVHDVEALVHSIDDRLGAGATTALTADLGPKERYRRWLRVLRGHSQVVVGTRASVFAPVTDLRLVVVWDDGDDLHAEPRAPYPHAREVAALRSHLTGCALLVMGNAVTPECAAWVERGFARPLGPARAQMRAVTARVHAADEGSRHDDDPHARSARLPTVAWRAAHEALRAGPVLVQVPRRGYVPGLACTRCRTRATCPQCHGPLVVGGRSGGAACAWCAHAAQPWTCPECGSHQLRALAVGAARTADELGQAFPGSPVLLSGGQTRVTHVPDRPALIVATPGAEPLADGGYAAALLLDADAMLSRADLRVGEETLRRWLNAAALVRPASNGGQVVVVGAAQTPSVQALIRWDPVGFARRELAERRAAHLPPAVRLVSLHGPAAAVDDLLARAALPQSVEVFGPVPDDDAVRSLLKVPLSQAASVVDALRAAQGERSAHKAPHHVRVQVDPIVIA